jgi:hypothetical protein
MPYHAANLLKDRCIGHCIGLPRFIALPDKAGNVAMTIGDMAVEAVEGEVGAAAFEPGCFHTAGAYVKIVRHVVVLPLLTEMMWYL